MARTKLVRGTRESQTIYRDTCSFDLIDCGDTPMLSPEEERDLGERIALGDREAVDHLVRVNLRLVVVIAKRYRRRGLNLEDLVGEGNLGLIKAAESFDVSRGTRFVTHAMHLINKSISLALSSQTTTIRLPTHTRTMYRTWRRKEDELQETLGRCPTYGEIGSALGWSRTRLATMKMVLNCLRPVASIEEMPYSV